MFIAVWPWETYLGGEALENGIAVGVSSWRQRGINSTPPAIKACGQYINSSLARVEANQHGYGEAILLNEDGKVTEGTGENVFIVKDGVLITPPVSDGLLEGITRDSIMQIARDKGYHVHRALDRAHRALPRRRDVHDRLGRRGRAGRIGRPPADLPSGSDHQGTAGDVLPRRDRRRSRRT